MRRGAVLLVGALVVGAPALAAQAVPEFSQAARLHPAFRRTPAIGVDPFRHVFWPGWGLAVQSGGWAANNSLNFADVGAVIFLSDRDSLRIDDLVNAFGLVPPGAGVGGVGAAEGGAYLGGPFGGGFALGLTAHGRGYGAFQLDDDAVAFFRDGTGSGREFLFGESRGATLVTAEAGVHALLSLGPAGSVDGPRVHFGFGGRYLRPLVYAKGTLATDSRLAVSDTAIAADVTVNVIQTVDTTTELGGIVDTTLGLADGGSGIAADFLLRLTWPTSGFALEAMVVNLGSVTVEGVRREALTFKVNSNSLKEVSDSLDNAEFEFQGTDTVDVTLPRIVRLAASGWANRILQLDVAATLPVSGEFESPLIVELGSTWRLANALPLRLGLVLGGRQGTGYTGGLALETRHLLFRMSGGSLGGLFRNAKGAAGRFEFGVFF